MGDLLFFSFWSLFFCKNIKIVACMSLVKKNQIVEEKAIQYSNPFSSTLFLLNLLNICFPIKKGVVNY